MSDDELGDVARSPALPRGFLHRGERPEERLYLNLLDTAGVAETIPSRCEVLVRLTQGVVSVTTSVDHAIDWARGEGDSVAHYVQTVLDRLSISPKSFAGFALDRPLIMGIVNVTPDSFSDGGEALRFADAVSMGRSMIAAGADILDIGGESTRPGAVPVTPEEELKRVIPVIEALANAGATVSVDTRRPRVMKAAIDAGARIVNDVTALTADPDSPAVAKAAKVPVILMHMQGEPGTMQENPRYDNAPLDVYDYLAARVDACEAAGIPRSRLALDPGIGFGKTVTHNLEILARIGLYHSLGCPILLGVSRKSFIGRLNADAPPRARVPGSLSAALWSIAHGVSILRVHDVVETRQALNVWTAIQAAAHPFAVEGS